jgi:hypothetical protein
MLFERRTTMQGQHDHRVLGRTGARELTLEETARIAGGTTPCTSITTHVGHAIDDLVDGCL